MTNRRYFVLDTATKKLVADENGFPRKFETVNEAGELRTEMLPHHPGPDSLTLLDDVGNKWIWSAKGVMRVAMSQKSQSAAFNFTLPIRSDRSKEWALNTFRCTVAGEVEQEAQARLPDGPEIKNRWGDNTTERWAEKSHWINRGPLAPMIADIKTQEHPQETRARREFERAKKRRERAEYLAGKQMTCQACGRAICSKLGGVVAHHGYERPGDGYQTASCMGAKEVPLEVSNVILLKVIAHWDNEVEYLTQKVIDVGNEDTPVRYVHAPYTGSREPKANPVIYMLRRATFEADKAASKGNLDDSFDFYKTRHIAILEHQLHHCRRDLAGCRKRNEGWKQTHAFVAGEWERIALANLADVAA
jgi:hypothetical protein